MNLVLTKIFIPTSDKNLSLRFFTFLFDCEILEDAESNEYTLLGSVPLYFCDQQAIENTQTKAPSMAFSVSPDFDLSDISNKIEFFCYRENLPIPKYELSDHQLIMHDFDGNTWQFESANGYTQLLSSNSDIDNVRNC